MKRSQTPPIRHLCTATVVAFWLSAVVPVGATAIVVLRTPHKLVLAGDSVVTIGNRHDTVCKVVPVGHYWVGAAGIYGNEDNSFSIFALLESIRVASTSAIDTLTRIRDTVAPSLAAFLDSEYRLAPNGFNTVFSPFSPRKGLALTLYVAGYENAVPTVFRLILAVSSLDITRGPVVSAYIRQCPGDWCPDGALYEGAGNAGPTIRSLLKPPYLSWIKKADAAAAGRLIQAEIAEGEGEVGPPVNVLVFNKNGTPHWDHRDSKSSCPDIAQTQ